MCVCVCVVDIWCDNRLWVFRGWDCAYYNTCSSNQPIHHLVTMVTQLEIAFIIKFLSLFHLIPASIQWTVTKSQALRCFFHVYLNQVTHFLRRIIWSSCPFGNIDRAVPSIFVNPAHCKKFIIMMMMVMMMMWKGYLMTNTHTQSSAYFNWRHCLDAYCQFWHQTNQFIGSETRTKRQTQHRTPVHTCQSYENLSTTQTITLQWMWHFTTTTTICYTIFDKCRSDWHSSKHANNDFHLNCHFK